MTEHNPYSPPAEPANPGVLTLWEAAAIRFGSAPGVIERLRGKDLLDPAASQAQVVSFVGHWRRVCGAVLLWLVGVPLLPVFAIYLLSALVWGNGWLWALVSAAVVFPFSFLILRWPCARLLSWHNARLSRGWVGTHPVRRPSSPCQRS
jgi:hypothetical protein